MKILIHSEDDLDTIHFNVIASTIQKIRTFRLLRRMQNLLQSTWDHEILYADRASKGEQLLLKPFCGKPKI
jgi:hypothetical protein